MIKELSIKNFRSIREATLELGRFTVLTGANNSGKSSVLYALQVLQNTMYNSNRPIDEFFNLKFVNLGGLKETSFNKNARNDIEIKVNIEKGQYECSFQVIFDEINGHSFSIQGKKPYVFSDRIKISFPYPQNKIQKIRVKDQPNIEFSWNGIRPDFVSAKTPESSLKVPLLSEEAIAPLESIVQLDLIPTQRGFTKPTFSEVPLRDLIYLEEEVASVLLKENALQERVDYYFNKVTGMHFSLRKVPLAGFFFLSVEDKGTDFWTELVNQGMGINQIIFMLTKILYEKNRLICIDEPEIHLHPALIEQFVRVLVEIAEREDKQFIFSTHSEHWLMSMLAEVNDGNLGADALKVYYLTREKHETRAENQQVQPNGQIQGGLKNFMEAQMRLANRFFTIETA